MKRVELIRKNEVAAAALDVEDETFIIHVVSIISPSSDVIHPSRKA